LARHRLSAVALREAVIRQARNRCEYCHAPQRACGYRFHLDHVLPSVRGGNDELENRALACASCNLAKGERIAGLDPLTQIEALFFNPRTQLWADHFRWNEDWETLVGLTPTGRATVFALDVNNSLRLEARRFWFQLDLLP
jgi:hypothetical protein